MAIGYMDVRVPKEKLARLKHEMDTALGPKKFGRYKAWLHFANLDMWQAQGHHFHYLTEVGDAKKLICTCGIYLVEEDLAEPQVMSSTILMKSSEFVLDRVQKVKGHKSLNDFTSNTCALIFDYTWIEETSGYLWSAYCQECGDLMVEQRNEVAKDFVAAHNAKCLVAHE
jgi:hypothetical protein